MVGSLHKVSSQYFAHVDKHRISTQLISSHAIYRTTGSVKEPANPIQIQVICVLAGWLPCRPHSTGTKDAMHGWLTGGIRWVCRMANWRQWLNPSLPMGRQRDTPTRILKPSPSCSCPSVNTTINRRLWLLNNAQKRHSHRQEGLLNGFSGWFINSHERKEQRWVIKRMMMNTIGTKGKSHRAVQAPGVAYIFFCFVLFPRKGVY